MRLPCRSGWTLWLAGAAAAMLAVGTAAAQAPGGVSIGGGSSTTADAPEACNAVDPGCAAASARMGFRRDLPEWYVAAAARMDAGADELESDAAALRQAWAAIAAGSKGRLASQIATLATGPGEKQIAEAAAKEAAFDLTNFSRSVDEFPASVEDTPGTIRDARGAGGAFGGEQAGDPRHRRWFEGMAEGLDMDLAEWRARRPEADAALETWLKAAEASVVATVRSVLAGQRREKHEAGNPKFDFTDVAWEQLVKADGAAAAAAGARRIEAQVAKAGLHRVTFHFDVQRFSFFYRYPVDLVGRLQVDRIAYADAMKRYDAASKRLEDAALANARRAVDADTGVYAEIGETLVDVGNDLEGWLFDWYGALDFPADEIGKIEAAVDAAIKGAEDLEDDAADSARASSRNRDIDARRRELKQSGDGLTAQLNAFNAAGNRAGAEALGPRFTALSDAAGALSDENFRLLDRIEEVSRAVFSLSRQRRLHPPDRPPVFALVAGLASETGWNPFDPDAAGPQRVVVARRIAWSELLQGLPFLLRPVGKGGYIPDELVEFDAAADAGAGAQPVKVSSSGTGDILKDRVVLVSAGADRTLAAPPPSAEPSLIELVRAVDAGSPASPIAGKWEVSYADTTLGRVRGTATIAPDGKSAEIVFIHPKSGARYPMVAASIRREGRAYAMELAGQPPHGDLTTVPESQILENMVVRVLASAPQEGVRLQTGGAGKLTVSFGDQRAEFNLRGGAPAEKAPLKLTLRTFDPLTSVAPFEASEIVDRDLTSADLLLGLWEEPVDPATRQSPGGVGRYGLLDRDISNPNRARQRGVEIWQRFRPPAIQLLAQTVDGPIKVTRFYYGVPTIVEVVFAEPQKGSEFRVTVDVAGARQEFTARRDSEDYRRFVTGVILPGAQPKVAGAPPR